MKYGVGITAWRSPALGLRAPQIKFRKTVSGSNTRRIWHRPVLGPRAAPGYTALVVMRETSVKAVIHPPFKAFIHHLRNLIMEG